MEAQNWDGFCGFSKEYTDDANGKCNHMQCPFWSNFYQCRDLYKGLEAYRGDQGVKATENQYQAIKRKRQETWPNWKKSDTPPTPSRKNKWGKREGSRGDSGKGKGKGKSKGKGKGS